MIFGENNLMKFTKRRKILLSLLALTIVTIPVVYVVLTGATPQEPTIIPPTESEGPQLVVPETPLGYIGTLTAIVTAISLYALIVNNKKTK